MWFGSVCSGIEAASVAWHPLGWRASFVSEIEKFPCAVLKSRWPSTPLHGDFTTIKETEYDPIDLLVGGTPCQDFSVAGLRAGMAGDRGNLTLQFLTLAGRLRPEWLVWENVPGVLSSNGGRDFGAFLGGLGELGYGWAYRTLDAQHFGVPQRRRRVFVVGHLGDWRCAAAVLFERHSLQGHSAPRRQARKDVAPTISARTKGRGGLGTDFDCDGGLIADASEDGTGRGTPIIPILEAGARTGKSTDDIRAGSGIGEAGDPMYTLQSGKQHAIAFQAKQSASAQSPSFDDVAPTLDGAKAGGMAIALRGREGGATAELSELPSAVRRLTPRECERLQGFPDDYTLIEYRGKLAADGPRYKVLGNSMAVPVMHWIGQRIELVHGFSP